jgi:DNA repair protein RadC
VFREAVRRGAHAVILAHNHPSGNPEPSPEDVRLTERLREAGALLGIVVLDHLVIGDGRFTSLRERGLGF